MEQGNKLNFEQVLRDILHFLSRFCAFLSRSGWPRSTKYGVILPPPPLFPPKALEAEEGGGRRTESKGEVTQQGCEKGTTHSSNNLKGGREDILGNKAGVKKTLPFKHHTHPTRKRNSSQRPPGGAVGGGAEKVFLLKCCCLFNSSTSSSSTQPLAESQQQQQQQQHPKDLGKCLFF